jgi:hypothetical protein
MRTESAFQHIFYDNSGAVKTMVLCLSISGELPDKTFGEVLQILAVMHMVPGGSEFVSFESLKYLLRILLKQLDLRPEHC